MATEASNVAAPALPKVVCPAGVVSGAICRESPLRSVAKAISYRVLGTLVTMAVAWAVTDRLATAAAIGLGDTVIKIFTFYFHERVWDRIGFGRKRGSQEEPAAVPLAEGPP